MPVKKKISVIRNTSKSESKAIKKNGTVSKQENSKPQNNDLLIEKGKLIECRSKKVRKIIIPKGVTEIGEGAFSDCDH